MAIALAEREPQDYTYLITPTGNELPEMMEHWSRLECILHKPLTRVSQDTLASLIQIQNALPNARMRWCTRILKIEPCIRWMRSAGPAILYVGLRADEEERQGLYHEDIQCRYPMREWGWTEADVWEFLYKHDITIPYRTDCAWCYDQRLSQWRRLWQTHPDLYREAEAIEAKHGHTFRSPTRDHWPAALKELRAQFEAGKIPRGSDDQLTLWESEQGGRCRICTL